MSLHQQRHHAALLCDQHIEGAASRTRIHDLKPDTGAQEACAEGRCRENLSQSGSQKHELRFERKDPHWIESGEITHVPNLRQCLNDGCAEHYGSVISGIVDLQLPGSIRADKMSGGT